MSSDDSFESFEYNFLQAFEETTSLPDIKIANNSYVAEYIRDIRDRTDLSHAEVSILGGPNPMLQEKIESEAQPFLDAVMLRHYAYVYSYQFAVDLTILATLSEPVNYSTLHQHVHDATTNDIIIGYQGTKALRSNIVNFENDVDRQKIERFITYLLVDIESDTPLHTPNHLTTDKLPFSIPSRGYENPFAEVTGYQTCLTEVAAIARRPLSIEERATIKKVYSEYYISVAAEIITALLTVQSAEDIIDNIPLDPDQEVDMAQYLTEHNLKLPFTPVEETSVINAAWKDACEYLLPIREFKLLEKTRGTDAALVDDKWKYSKVEARRTKPRIIVNRNLSRFGSSKADILTPVRFMDHLLCASGMDHYSAYSNPAIDSIIDNEVRLCTLNGRNSRPSVFHGNRMEFKDILRRVNDEWIAFDKIPLSAEPKKPVNIDFLRQKDTETLRLELKLRRKQRQNPKETTAILGFHNNFLVEAPLFFEPTVIGFQFGYKKETKNKIFETIVYDLVTQITKDTALIIVDNRVAKELIHHAPNVYLFDTASGTDPFNENYSATRQKAEEIKEGIAYICSNKYSHVIVACNNTRELDYDLNPWLRNRVQSNFALITDRVTEAGYTIDDGYEHEMLVSHKKLGRRLPLRL